MVGLVVVALVLSRVIDRGGAQVSQDHAVEIARPHVEFTPEGYNIRLVRQGIPPQPFWAVSFWIKNTQGKPTRVTVVLVDADTGAVSSVRSTD